MDYNYLITGSTNSNYLKEDFINKLNIVEYYDKLYTINSLCEKFYTQIKTALIIDDYSNIAIRFFKPHMITSEDEFLFYQLIGYVPLTKKYFYKLNGFSNYLSENNQVSIQIKIDVFNYKYDYQLSKNFLSNFQNYDDMQIDSLLLNSSIDIVLNLYNIKDVNTNVESFINILIDKMNCVLFDDIIIYEKLKTEHSLEFFISNSLYNPITFKYNNLCFSENDIFALPYKTIVNKTDNTNVLEIFSIQFNHILYKDLTYFLDLKSGNYNKYSFLQYSNLLPVEIKNTGMIDGVYNQYSNKNFLYNRFLFNSFNILNSLKLKNENFEINYYDILTNYLLNVLTFNYNTITYENVIKLYTNDQNNNYPIKEYIYYDKEGKYKNVMFNQIEYNSLFFRQNTIPNTILEITTNLNNDVLEKEQSPTNVSLVTYITFDITEFDVTLRDIVMNETYHVVYSKMFSSFYIKMDTNLTSDYNTFPSIISDNYNRITYFYPIDLNISNCMCFTLSEEHYYNFYSYFNNFFHKTAYIKSSTPIDTKLTNTDDEFTISLYMTIDKTIGSNIDKVGFKIGDFLKIINSNIYVLDQYVSKFENFQKTTKKIFYTFYKDERECEFDITYFITIRYFNNEVIFEITDLTLSENCQQEFFTNSKRFSLNLSEHKELNLSDIVISSQLNGEDFPDYSVITIGDINIKNRYVEDFILYDFKNSLFPSGNRNIISIY